MLKQLTDLSRDCDGRYAQNQDLKFLKDYLDSAEGRIKAYEKMTGKAEEIVESWEEAKRNYPQDLFHQGSYDMTDICKRDMKDALRCAAAAMLFNDLDRLREGMLIWYGTIVKSFRYTKYAAVVYLLIQDVIKLYLDPLETEMILPVLQLQHAVLSN
ncbi:MAG: hypothetical protein N5P05_002797 [Chroococcopsis gigantea SAG 12.99]|jgi:hypothetical protein|nr:hypothetical protein [Chlorogloea purpurea SAG 13.99]MDV3001191.1 hypothetical protein [Chroococcopsis gigantea SAG 12.99]